MSRAKPLKVPYEKLKESHKLFIEYYIQTENASEALRKIGYKGNRVSSRASEIKTQLMPYIKERLKRYQVQGQSKELKKQIADSNEILEILTRIARGEEKDAFGLDTTNGDKIKALELLGKANQLYVDRVKQDTSVDINVNLIDGNEPELIEGELIEDEDRRLLEEGE